MTSKADQAVQERRLRPIYDALDSGQFKKAIQEADKVLKKHPKTNCAKVLKALAFIRTERLAEASEILEEVDSPNAPNAVHDDNTLSALSHCYKEADVPEKITALYERAVAQAPTESNLTNLFTAYVRTRDYKKQQMTAMRLYKETNTSPFFFWAIMSIVMQANHNKEHGSKILLPLAQKMIDAQLVKTSYKVISEIDLHLMVLEGLQKYNDCAELLQSDKLKEFNQSHSQVVQKLMSFLLAAKDYDKVEAIAWEQLNENPDDWYMWRCLVDVIYARLLASEENANSEVSEFWQKLCDFAEKMSMDRGPKMAKLHFLLKLRTGPEKVKQLDKTLEQASPVHMMLAYIKQYFSKPTCFPDLRLFISMLSDEERKTLDDLMTLFVGDILNSEDVQEGDETQIWAIVLYEKMRRAMDLTENMSKEEKRKHIRHVMSQMMTNGISDLAGGALTQLIAIVLWEEWKKNDDPQSAFELILILEWSAIRFKSDSFAKILLIKIYAYYGNLLRITALTKSLDIKSMQRESLGYLTFPLFELSGRVNMAIVHYTSLSAYYDNAEREIMDCVVSAYKNGSFASIPSLIQLGDNMKSSMQAIAGDVLSRYLSGLMAIEKFDEAINMLNGDEEDIDWEKLVDNRDFGIVPSFYAVDHQQHLADVSNYSREEFKDHIGLVHYLCKALAAVGRVNKTSLQQMKEAIGKFADKHDKCREKYTQEHELSRDMHAPTSVCLAAFVHSPGLALVRAFLCRLLKYGDEQENSHEKKFFDKEELKKGLNNTISIFTKPGADSPLPPLSLHTVLFSASRALQALAAMRLAIDACKVRFAGKDKTSVSLSSDYYRTAHELVKDAARNLSDRLKEVYSLLGEPGIVPKISTDWGEAQLEILTEQSLAVETRFCKSYGSSIEQMQDIIKQFFQ